MYEYIYIYLFIMSATDVYSMSCFIFRKPTKYRAKNDIVFKTRQKKKSDARELFLPGTRELLRSPYTRTDTV